jgi:hypothetical protein
VQSFARVHPKEADVTARFFSLVAALALVPVMARSEAAAEPAAAAAPADQQTPSSGPGSPSSVVIPPKLQERTDFQLSLTTLDALRKKGSITEAEYNAALRDLISVGQRAASAPTFVVGRFVTTLYGYLEGDVIHDSQRGFAGLDGYGGSPTLSTRGTFLGDNGRTVFSSRGTRLGMRFAAPEVSGIRVRANFEMDFVGNQPGSPFLAAGTTASRGLSESAFFTNPTPRIRQAFVQVDNDFVTVWIGQTWNVMAFAAAFLPTSIQSQGLPGQLFGRNPQVRLSHLFDANIFSVEAVAAAVRGPQFDSEVPDFQGGLKFNINKWTGVQSIGSTATTISPASVAVTGATRRIKLATAISGGNAIASDTVTGNVVALDAFIPVIAAKERGTFAVSLLGEATTGTGMGDLFSGLSGGMAVGSPPGTVVNPATNVANNYTPFQDIDAGIAGFNTISGRLDTVDFRTLLVGAQFSYGKVVLAGNYSSVYSGNVARFTGTTWNQQSWWDANLIVDPWTGVRFGLEFARTLQRRTTGQLANNSRVFFGTFFLF